MKKFLGPILAGAGAGAVNGLFGAGGGMVLVPLLGVLTDLEDQEVFPASVSIILPICLVSLTISGMAAGIPWRDALPYLIGSAAGGILAGFWGKKIPTAWLHRGLGLLILWGGVRYLW
ncbi:MAG: sulfite exporter TauE/SafE family protein [Oscillospiraceae bacterium]|nr:sulfite exporter TauE/SafE family protein [Oscillospiraceae bacterium]